jgi:predicted nucleotidyltransferase
MVDESIVASVRNYLRALADTGLPVRFGVVFGSYATGRADEWSDIDLLVVSPSFDAKRSHDQVSLLWRTAAHTDTRIEPIPCGEKQWREDDGSTIIEVARREGELVNP